MSIPVPLEFGKIYHLFYPADNREDIFWVGDDYRNFMELYVHYVRPVANTYAYCLLRNHFHFLVRIMTKRSFSGAGGRKLSPTKGFLDLFEGYAEAFGHIYQRSAPLFQQPFGRIEVLSEAHFLLLVAYIHRNPARHKLVSDWEGWPYSSYPALCSEEETFLEREEVLARFGGREAFVAAHSEPVDAAEIVELVAEDRDD